ncbi:MAG: GNAT family N-acetyltransferase [Ruminococcus sp.]|nr:GNAT family N-acetyltransferase [Ruminococcus sp.]
MKITIAEARHLQIVENIVNKTIQEIYPHYYPKGAVDFFLSHHNETNILKDILNNCVYLLSFENNYIGTVTVNNNEINRLFVLPEFQNRGFGSALLEFAENIVAKSFDEISLSASFPAKKLYQKRGYVETDFNFIATDNGDLLCYDTMTKPSNLKKYKICYDNKKFIPKINSENGEVDASTVFCYHQKGSTIWAEYSGGEISKGFLIGTTDYEGNLDFHYQHINKDGQIRIGKCKSIPKITDNGKLELTESWQWLNGDYSTGNSVLIEI